MTPLEQLRALPTDRVVALRGASDDLTTVAARGPADLPAVIAYDVSAAQRPADFVRAALDELDRIAVGLFPGWLPGAEDIRSPGGAGLAAIRAIAATHAASSAHFRPFLMDLAERSLRGAAPHPGRFPLQTRAVGLARVTAASFHRPQTVLLVRAPATLGPAAQHSVVAGCEWLAGRGGPGVWLAGSPFDAVDWVSIVDIDVGPAAPVPVLGKPHPGSTTEAALESALARHDWAAGRAWNQTYRFDPLAGPVRLDLVWSAERCVVELDGPEHRRPDVFEADRRRDVRLQLDGYAVLRFTNARIQYDIETVVAQIRTFIQTRREGQRDG